MDIPKETDSIENDSACRGDESKRTSDADEYIEKESKGDANMNKDIQEMRSP